MLALCSINKVNVVHKPIISSQHGGKCPWNVQGCLARINGPPIMFPGNVPSALLFVFCPSYSSKTSSLWDYLTFIIIDKALKSRLVLRTFITHKCLNPQCGLKPVETGWCDQHGCVSRTAINSLPLPDVRSWSMTGIQHLSWWVFVRQMFFHYIFNAVSND